MTTQPRDTNGQFTAKGTLEDFFKQNPVQEEVTEAGDFFQEHNYEEVFTDVYPDGNAYGEGVFGVNGLGLSVNLPDSTPSKLSVNGRQFVPDYLKVFIKHETIVNQVYPTNDSSLPTIVFRVYYRPASI